MRRNPHRREHRKLIARVSARSHGRSAVEIQGVSEIQPENLTGRPESQVEIPLPVFGVRGVLAVWDPLRSGEVCQAVEVVDPPVVRVELIQVGLGRIHSQVAVRIVAPTKCVDHQVVEQKTAAGAIRSHHQAGIEEPETRVVVLVAAEFVAVAMYADRSNAEFNAGDDVVRSPRLVLRCRLLSRRSLGLTGGLSSPSSTGRLLEGNYPRAA